MDCNEVEGEGGDLSELELALLKLRNEMSSGTAVRMTNQEIKDIQRVATTRNAAYIENELEMSVVVHENKQLTELADKNKRILEQKSKEYRDLIDELERQLQRAENNLELTQGRLEESRRSKDDLNKQLKELEQSHLDELAKVRRTLKEKDDQIDGLNLEIERLRGDVEEIGNRLQSIKESGAELEAATVQLTVMENKLKEKENRVDKLESEKSKLEQELTKFEADNAQLRAQLAEYVDQCKNKIESEDAAHKILNEQLSNFQQNCEDLKSQLTEAKTKAVQLEKDLDEANRQNRLLKVDIRLLNREKSDFTAKLTEKDARCQELEKKMSTLDSQAGSTNSQLRSLQEEVESLKCAAKEKEKEFIKLASSKEVLSDQKGQLEAENLHLKSELDAMRVQLRDYNNLKETLAKKEDLIADKTSQVNLKENKIGDLEKNVKTLINALKQIEADNKKYFDIIQNQVADTQGLKKMQEMLEKENKDVREQLRQAKISLNEAKSMKAFTEKRLETTEKSLRTESQMKDSEVQSIREQLAAATLRNEELSKELTGFVDQTSALEADNFKLRMNVEELNGKNERLQTDLNRCIKTLVDAKTELINLKEAFKESLTKGESYKQKWETCQEQLSVLQETSRISELQQSSIIQQQKNVIDELIVLVPKKKKGGIFTPKQRSEKPVLRNKATPCETQTNKVLPETTALGVVEQELFVVDCLAQTRNALLAEKENKILAAKGLRCQEIGGTPLKTPTLPAPRKEENILLKEQRCNTIATTTPNKGLLTLHKHDLRCTRTDSIKKCMSCLEPISKDSPASECRRCGLEFHLACALTVGNTCGVWTSSEEEGNSS